MSIVEANPVGSSSQMPAAAAAAAAAASSKQQAASSEPQAASSSKQQAATWDMCAAKRRTRKLTAPSGLPRRSPTPVLTGPCAAQLRRSEEIRCIRHGMAVSARNPVGSSNQMPAAAASSKQQAANRKQQAAASSKQQLGPCVLPSGGRKS